MSSSIDRSVMEYCQFIWMFTDILCLMFDVRCKFQWNCISAKEIKLFISFSSTAKKIIENSDKWFYFVRNNNKISTHICICTENGEWHKTPYNVCVPYARSVTFGLWPCYAAFVTEILPTICWCCCLHETINAFLYSILLWLILH